MKERGHVIALVGCGLPQRECTSPGAPATTGCRKLQCHFDGGPVVETPPAAAYLWNLPAFFPQKPCAPRHGNPLEAGGLVDNWAARIVAFIGNSFVIRDRFLIHKSILYYLWTLTIWVSVSHVTSCSLKCIPSCFPR